jgi:superfamily II DNA or RNA helicase
LVPCSIYFVPIKETFKGKNYHKLYSDAIVNNKPRNEAIVNIAKKMKETKNMTTLILIQRIEHGEMLLEMLNKQLPQKANIINVQDDKTGKQVAIRVKNIEFLSGKDDAVRRKAVIQAVKEKKVEILIGSTIADKLLSA